MPKRKELEKKKPHEQCTKFMLSFFNATFRCQAKRISVEIEIQVVAIDQIYVQRDQGLNKKTS